MKKNLFILMVFFVFLFSSFGLASYDLINKDYILIDKITLKIEHLITKDPLIYAPKIITIVNSLAKKYKSKNERFYLLLLKVGQNLEDNHPFNHVELKKIKISDIKNVVCERDLQEPCFGRLACECANDITIKNQYLAFVDLLSTNSQALYDKFDSFSSTLQKVGFGKMYKMKYLDYGLFALELGKMNGMGWNYVFLSEKNGFLYEYKFDIPIELHEEFLNDYSNDDYGKLTNFIIGNNDSFHFSGKMVQYFNDFSKYVEINKSIK